MSQQTRTPLTGPSDTEFWKESFLASAGLAHWRALTPSQRREALRRRGQGQASADAVNAMDLRPPTEPFAALARRHGLAVALATVPRNPLRLGCDRDSATHYRVMLRGDRRRLTTSISPGPGQPPSPGEILALLTLETRALLTATGFDDWALNCGRDPDNRSTCKTFEHCRRTIGRLRRFLGPLLDQFLAIDPQPSSETVS
jgi:hypothetical protein